MSRYKWLNTDEEMMAFFVGLPSDHDLARDSEYDGTEPMVVDTLTKDALFDFGGFYLLENQGGTVPSDHHKKIILDALNASVADVSSGVFNIDKYTQLRSECDLSIDIQWVSDDLISIDGDVDKDYAIAIAKHFKLTGEDLK